MLVSIGDIFYTCDNVAFEKSNSLVKPAYENIVSYRFSFFVEPISAS